MLTYFILATTLICLTDGLALFKNKQWRELGTLGLLIAAAILLVMAKKFDIPTPADVLQQMFRPVGEVIFGARE